jgi:hypothetical protein
LDLNQATLRFLAGPRVDWSTLMRDEGVFGDQRAYLEEWRSVTQVAGVLAGLESQALVYLDTAVLLPELRRVLEEQVRQVLAFAPTVLGLSVLYPSQVPFALALSKALRDSASVCPHLIRREPLEIVLGGASLSALHLDDLLLACPFLDAAVPKEGEQAVLSLCRGERAKEIPGACSIEHGKLKRNPSPQAVCLATAALPDFSDFDLKGYFVPTPVLPVLFSRDCRYRRCRFCAHNFSSAGYRSLSPARFVEGLAQIQSATGARHFYFADQYIDAADLEAIAQHIETTGLDVRWSVMARAQTGYTDGVLQTMQRAGCVWISWGLETGSQLLLDIAAKGALVTVGEEVVQRAAAAGISNLAMMVFGLPGSDDEAFEQTADLLERLDSSLDAMTQSCFVLFEGTPFANQAERFGLVNKGNLELVRVDGKKVRSMRLAFAEVGSDGSARPPRGPIEVAAWNKRRVYMCTKSVFDDLPAEHYLVMAALAP